MNTFNLSYEINGNVRNAANIEAADFLQAKNEIVTYWAGNGVTIKNIKFKGEFNGSHRIN